MEVLAIITAGLFVSGFLILILGDEDLKILAGGCLLLSVVMGIFLVKVDEKCKESDDYNINIETASEVSKDSSDMQTVYDVVVANSKIGKITYLPPVNFTNGSWLAEIYVSDKVVCYGLAHTPEASIKDVMLNGGKRLANTINHLSSARRLIKRNSNHIKLSEKIE